MGGDGNFWEIQGDWRAEIGGGWRVGDERVRKSWRGGRVRAKLNIFQPFSCNLSSGLGYTSWEGLWFEDSVTSVSTISSEPGKGHHLVGSGRILLIFGRVALQQA